jgi:L-ascorbate metabolism protein UlaG (beta-lactamase superfamily)
MTVTSFGHSALQIVTDDGTTILVDPFLTGNRHAEGVVSPDDLAPDVLLLTHAHGDHWGDTPSIVERAAPLVISNYEIATYVQQHLGHENAFGMNTGGSASFPWGRVTLTYARHSSSFPDGTYGGLAGGFLLHIDGRCLYLAGDTCRFAEMAWLGESHDIDIAALPIGDTFTMGPEEAVEAAKMLRPALTIPLHYGTFPPIEVDPQAWAAQMKGAGLAARVPAPGEAIEI